MLISLFQVIFTHSASFRWSHWSAEVFGLLP